MKNIPFELRSGRPIEIIVEDDEGKKWAIMVQVSILEVSPKPAKNPDGSPQFDVNFGLSMNTRPFEGS